MEEVTGKLPLGVLIGPVLFIAVATGLVLLRDWQPSSGASAHSAAAPHDAAAQPVRYRLPVSSTQPSQGPRDALVTVVEWCDLRGPAAREGEAAKRALMERYDGKLRWVHRALVDAEQHDLSLHAHRIARGAFQHAGKFWELRAWLLELPDATPLDEATLRRGAETVGFDYDQAEKAAKEGSFEPALQIDRIFASKFGVTPPSAYFVNGLSVPTVPGEPLKVALKAAVKSELARAEKLVATGVPPADVYAALVEDGAWQASAQGVGPR